MKTVKLKHLYLSILICVFMLNILIPVSTAQTLSGVERLKAGILNYEEGSYEEALFNLEMALAELPEGDKENLWDAHFYLGLAYLLLGDADESKMEFNKAQKMIKNKSPDPFVHSPKIVELFKEAVVIKKPAISGAANIAIVEDLLDKAIQLYRQEEYEEAIAKWEKVLTLDPGNLEAKFNKKFVVMKTNPGTMKTVPQGHEEEYVAKSEAEKSVVVSLANGVTFNGGHKDPVDAAMILAQEILFEEDENGPQDANVVRDIRIENGEAEAYFTRKDDGELVLVVAPQALEHGDTPQQREAHLLRAILDAERRFAGKQDDNAYNAHVILRSKLPIYRFEREPWYGESSDKQHYDLVAIVKGMPAKEVIYIPVRSEYEGAVKAIKPVADGLLKVVIDSDAEGIRQTLILDVFKGKVGSTIKPGKIIGMAANDPARKTVQLSSLLTDEDASLKVKEANTVTSKKIDKIEAAIPEEHR